METEQAKLPPPPHLISSFAAGFDAIANHVAVILLPVLVDIFLWLGPHLRVKQFMLSLLNQTQSASAQLPIPAGSMPDPTAVLQTWTDIFSRFNLFAGLRTFPVGPASLMIVRMPSASPLGTPVVYDLSSIFSIGAWILLILMLGWIAGGLYYYSISSAALTLPRRPLLPVLFQVLVLCVFWLALLFLVGTPMLMLLSVIVIISPFLGQALMFMILMAVLWLVLPVFFSPHGIFAYQQNALVSIRTSMRLMRYTLPTSGLFLMGSILIVWGLDFLWRTPPETSWWAVVGIAGHAFVSTALLAASFVYYRDANAWLTAVMERLKKHPASIKI